MIEFGRDGAESGHNRKKWSLHRLHPNTHVTIFKENLQSYQKHPNKSVRNRIQYSHGSIYEYRRKCSLELESGRHNGKWESDERRHTNDFFKFKLYITEALCSKYLCEKDIEYLMDFAVVSTGDELCSHISKYCPKGLCKTTERSTKCV